MFSLSFGRLTTIANTATVLLNFNNKIKFKKILPRTNYLYLEYLLIIIIMTHSEIIIVT